MIDLIYCAGGNRRFAEIAIAAGFLYGSQLPETVYYPIHFADQDWKKPDRAAYMAALATHKPQIATVLDLERREQLPDVLAWAEEAAAHVETVIIIPKVSGIIDEIPHRIGGAGVRLGYSVPTKYGGTDVPLWEFQDRPVHLLGGSPPKQRTIARYLNVRSADGNMINRVAVKWCMVFDPERRAPDRDLWCRLWEYNGTKEADDAPYKAFEISARNVINYWRQP